MMRLIHCHRELEVKTLPRLLEALNLKSSCVVLRENALRSCSNTEIFNQLGNHATIYLLADQNATNLPIQLKQQVITNQKFVELCIEAEQVIGWN